MHIKRSIILILTILWMLTADGRNALVDRIVTTDLVGGNKEYVSGNPIMSEGRYYRATIDEYDGAHFANWAIYGRNADDEDWMPVYNFSGSRAGSFLCKADYRQVKVGWSKSAIEPGVTIGFRIEPETFDHSILHVSASEGDDANDGSIQSPFATIAKAISMQPGVIRLLCGDVFYESVRSTGIDFAPYSTGERPMVSGLKILPARAWHLTETTPSGMKIWKVDLSLDGQSYRGMRYGGNSYLNNIGGFVRVGSTPRQSELCGSRRVKSYDDLRGADAEDFDFFQPLDTPAKDTPAGNFDHVYVCYKGNPDGSFGVTSGCNGMEIGDCRIDSLTICHWGRHGIAGKSNVSITDCEIDGIGGMVQLEYPVFVCLGNGVEFYVHHPGISNCHVTGCHVSHCYDAGLTVQGTEHDTTDLRPLEAHDVTFTGNKIENCCQSFEEFLNGNNPTDIYYDCVFADNVSHSPGIDTGFRYSDGRYKRSHILTYENGRQTGMVYRGNICTDGNYLCVLSKRGRFAQGTWQDNRCTIRRGQDLVGNYNGTADVVTVPTHRGHYATLKAATDAAIARYRELTGDITTEFSVTD